MRKTLLALAFFATAPFAHAAGQYDGIWLESDGSYSVYSSIHTAPSGLMVKLDIEPDNRGMLLGGWNSTTYGMLIGPVATMSGDGQDCRLVYTLTFNSATNATIRIISAQPQPGRSCDMPEGGTGTINKLM